MTAADVAPADRRGRRPVEAAEPVPAARADVWRYRELLGNLVRKELKVKYKNSVLGLRLDAAQPVLYLVVFTSSSRRSCRSRSPYFAIFFLSGPAGLEPLLDRPRRGARVDRGQRVARAEGLVPPRDPAAGGHRRRAGALLPPGDRAVAALVAVPAARRTGSYCPLVPVALVRCSCSPPALGHRCWRRSTSTSATPSTCSSWRCWRGSGCRPIVYPYRLIADRLGEPASVAGALLNPMIPIVITFQRALYNPSADDTGPADLTPGSAGTLAQPRRSSASPSSVVLLFVGAVASSAGSRTTSPKRSRTATWRHAIEIDDGHQALQAVPGEAEVR